MVDINLLPSFLKKQKKAEKKSKKEYIEWSKPDLKRPLKSFEIKRKKEKVEDVEEDLKKSELLFSSKKEVNFVSEKKEEKSEDKKEKSSPTWSDFKPQPSKKSSVVSPPQEPPKPPLAPFGINLIPQEIISHYEPLKKLFNLIFALATGVVIILISAFGIALYQTNQFKEVQNLIDEKTRIEDKISKLRPLQKGALADQERLKEVFNILSKHVYWTYFFDTLKKYTHPDVYYTSFTGDVAGGIHLEAVAPDFKTVAEQQVILENAEFVERVEVVNAQLVEETPSEEGGSSQSETISYVKFNLNLVFKKEAFYSRTLN